MNALAWQENDMESGANIEDLREKTYRPAQQSRSMETERRFVLAAEKLFASMGYDGTRIADICELSGCSSGSFYHRFGDKFGLFKIMFRRYQDQVHRVVKDLDITKETNGDLEGLMLRFSEIAFETVNANVGFFRAVDELTPKHQDMELRILGLSRTAGDKLKLAAYEFSPHEKTDDVAQAIQHASQVIITLIVQTRINKAPMLPRERNKLIPICVSSAMGIFNSARSE